MKKRIVFAMAAVFIAAAAIFVFAQSKQFMSLLSGYEEVPALSTGASGEFQVRIANDQQSMQYTLSYSDLEGDVTQAHIHLGQKGVNGGISVWLCGNSPPTNPPPGTQTCPEPPATISGTITPDDVVGPAGQGISAGQFDELVRAMRAGATYVNVHTTMFPGGEVRSQIDPGRGPHH